MGFGLYKRFDLLNFHLRLNFYLRLSSSFLIHKQGRVLHIRLDKLS